MARAAAQLARLARRWVLAFSDVQGCRAWRQAVTGAWVRTGGAPQLSEDRPAAGFKTVTIAHQPERKQGGRRRPGGPADPPDRG